MDTVLLHNVSTRSQWVAFGVRETDLIRSTLSGMFRKRFSIPTPTYDPVPITPFAQTSPRRHFGREVGSQVVHGFVETPTGTGIIHQSEERGQGNVGAPEETYDLGVLIAEKLDATREVRRVGGN